MTSHDWLKRAVLGVAFWGVALAENAQVRFSLSSDAPAAVAAGEKFTLTLTAEIQEGWHISSITQPDGGPVRTEIVVPEKQAVKLAGAILAPKPHTEHSATFEIDVETHEGTVVFKLPLVAPETLKPGASLRVEVTFQACTEENCLMPNTETFSVALLPAATSASASEAKK